MNRIPFPWGLNPALSSPSLANLILRPHGRRRPNDADDEDEGVDNYNKENEAAAGHAGAPMRKPQSEAAGEGGGKGITPTR